MRQRRLLNAARKRLESWTDSERALIREGPSSAHWGRKPYLRKSAVWGWSLVIATSPSLESILYRGTYSSTALVSSMSNVDRRTLRSTARLVLPHIAGGSVSSPLNEPCSDAPDHALQALTSSSMFLTAAISTSSLNCPNQVLARNLSLNRCLSAKKADSIFDRR